MLDVAADFSIANDGHAAGVQRRHVVVQGAWTNQPLLQDIDRLISPELLGWNESELDDAPTPDPTAQAIGKIGGCLYHQGAGAFSAGTGQKPDNANWLSYELDGASKSPVLLFNYPSALPAASDYVQPFVKVEFGSPT